MFPIHNNVALRKKKIIVEEVVCPLSGMYGDAFGCCSFLAARFLFMNSAIFGSQKNADCTYQSFRLVLGQACSLGNEEKQPIAFLCFHSAAT